MFSFFLWPDVLSLVGLYVQPRKRSRSEIGLNLLTSLYILFIKVPFQQTSPVCSYVFIAIFREGQTLAHVFLQKKFLHDQGCQSLLWMNTEAVCF